MMIPHTLVTNFKEIGSIINLFLLIELIILGRCQCDSVRTENCELRINSNVLLSLFIEKLCYNCSMLLAMKKDKVAFDPSYGTM